MKARKTRLLCSVKVRDVVLSISSTAALRGTRKQKKLYAVRKLQAVRRGYKQALALIAKDLKRMDEYERSAIWPQRYPTS